MNWDQKSILHTGSISSGQDGTENRWPKIITYILTNAFFKHLKGGNVLIFTDRMIICAHFNSMGEISNYFFI